MKNIVVAAIALAVAGVGYFVYQNNAQPEIIQEAQTPPATAEPVEVVEAVIETETSTTVEQITETVQEATEQAVENVVEETKQAAQEALSSVVKGTSDVAAAVEAVKDVATGSAQEAAQNVVGTVTETATDVVTDVQETATDVVKDVQETATDVVQDVEETAQSLVEDAAAALTREEPAVSDPLSFAGFDLAKVSDRIDGSSANDMTKLALNTELQQAKDNPDQLKAILDQIKAALQK